MIYLLDTNTLIHMVRGLKMSTPATETHRKRRALGENLIRRCRDTQASGDQVGLSAITVAELEYGARHSGRYETEIAAVRKILTPFTLHDFDCTLCAVAYGEIRQALESAGAPIGAMDLLIAAHAKAIGATLVTTDLGDFSRIRHLRCEDWSKV